MFISCVVVLNSQQPYTQALTLSFLPRPAIAHHVLKLCADVLLAAPLAPSSLHRSKSRVQHTQAVLLPHPSSPHCPFLSLLLVPLPPAPLLSPLPSPLTLLCLPLHIPFLVCPFSLFASLLLSGAGKLGGESSVERLSRHVCILSPVCECACAYACACMCMCGEPVVPCLLIHAVAKVCAQACAR